MNRAFVLLIAKENAARSINERTSVSLQFGAKSSKLYPSFRVIDKQSFG
jgi:hypothetical protein